MSTPTSFIPEPSGGGADVPVEKLRHWADSVTHRQVPYGSTEYWEAVALRNEILRQPLGLSLSRAELEGESDSFHVVALHNNRVVGCVVLKPLGEARVRMRQLCVDPLYRGCGIGKALVQSAERLAAESGFTEVVLHARKQVVSFYEKLGYTPEGEFFVEVGIPHRRMRKKIVSVQPEGNPP